MISIWELANPQLREITVYQPGKPIEETARELGLDSGAIIKLASNENPRVRLPRQWKRCVTHWKQATSIRTAADFACVTQWQPDFGLGPRT